MGVKLTISRSAHDAILAHCAADSGVEACGLLIGHANAVREARPSENVAADPARAFEIAPAALFAAIREERRGGSVLLGHYHSHPHGGPEPSATDAAMAYDAVRYWIIVANGEMAAWRVTEPHHFTAVELCLASDQDEGQ